jgi:excinuclease UvrABC nuclease subunit
LDIVYEQSPGEGPFCRLIVEDTAPEQPGVYGWVQDDAVMYVGRANQLRQVVHGTRMGRAYNDYTYIPASKVAQTSSPRVRVNALLNRALRSGSVVAWWWHVCESPEVAVSMEARLINEWKPPWNRAIPYVLR